MGLETAVANDTGILQESKGGVESQVHEVNQQCEVSLLIDGNENENHGTPGIHSDDGATAANSCVQRSECDSSSEVIAGNKELESTEEHHESEGEKFLSTPQTLEGQNMANTTEDDASPSGESCGTAVDVEDSQAIMQEDSHALIRKLQALLSPAYESSVDLHETHPQKWGMVPPIIEVEVVEESIIDSHVEEESYSEIGDGRQQSGAVKATGTSAKKGKKRKTSKKKGATKKLPRRSSKRLKQKQMEQIDYSRLPPKYYGPAPPSMKFCDYVLNELLSSKYEPINWLIELPIVKKKLNYRQFANAEEFANEIRMLCMNPIDAALTDECLSLLQAFDKLWLHLPIDSEEPSSAPSNSSQKMEESDKSLQKLLIEAARKMNKTQTMLTKVELEESLLKNVKKKRNDARKAGEKVPALHQSVLNSAYTTLTKCGIASILDQESSKAVASEDIQMEEPISSYEASNSAEKQTPTPTNTRCNKEDKAVYTPLTHQEMVQLAQDLTQISMDEIMEIIEIILKYHTIEVPEGEEELIAIPFEGLTSKTLHEIREHVTFLLNKKRCDEPYTDEPSTAAEEREPSIAEAIVRLKCKKVRQKNANSRKQPKPVKRRASVVDVEARKRELVEGIKKLGGTGTTRPIRKQNSYATEDTRVRSSYFFDSSSGSSSSSSESWESSGGSDSSD